jgi:hypothetical protein
MSQEILINKFGPFGYIYKLVVQKEATHRTVITKDRTIITKDRTLTTNTRHIIPNTRPLTTNHAHEN